MRRPIIAAMLGAVLAGVAPADTPDPRIAQRFALLTRATAWVQVAAIPIAFRTFHPQGMVRVGDDFFVSAVEITTPPRKLAMPRDGHAYDAGSGVGHLFRIDPHGKLLADLRLGEGTIYHPGGIDYDGVSIWVPVAEYRPDSRAIVYRVDPTTMKATKVVAVADHIGGIVHDAASRSLVGLSWGARRLYTWPLGQDGAVAGPPTVERNPAQFIDYQDCHGAGPRWMLCAGVAEYRVDPAGPAFQLGGIDLVDLSDHRPVWQVPLALWSPSGRAMTQNPFWLEATATGLRAWFMPDDDASTLFAFEPAGR